MKKKQTKKSNSWQKVLKNKFSPTQIVTITGICFVVFVAVVMATSDRAAELSTSSMMNTSEMTSSEDRFVLEYNHVQEGIGESTVPTEARDVLLSTKNCSSLKQFASSKLYLPIAIEKEMLCSVIIKNGNPVIVAVGGSSTGQGLSTLTSMIVTLEPTQVVFRTDILPLKSFYAPVSMEDQQESVKAKMLQEKYIHEFIVSMEGSNALRQLELKAAAE